MSLALIKNLIFRSLSASPYITKGASLTWTEEDLNFKIIGDAIQELNTQNTSNFTAWNSGTTYGVTTPATYVSHASNTYKAIGTSTGVTPGTDITKWVITSAGEFAHVQNTDTKLASGTSNEVTASQLKIVVDAYAKNTSNATNPPTNTENLSQGYKFPSKYHTLANSIFICTASTNTTATWLLIFGSGD